jgi:cobalt/nickel transport system permease protein
VALLMQGVFFQYGGITTLGVNTIIMALPAVICYHLFAPLLSRGRKAALAAAFACGFCAVLLGAVIVGLALMFTEQRFLEVATLLVAAHLPVMVIEGLITAFTVVFLQKVQPSMLSAFHPAPQRPEGANK